MSYITKSVHKMILAMAAMVVALPSVVAAAPVGNENTELSYTWYTYGDHEYALTSTRTYWVDNEAEAVSVGGHLVTIETEAENTWLTTTFANTYCVGYDGNSSGACAQIGYYNKPTSGQWVWISGIAVGYTNYASDFPMGGTYAYIHLNPHPTAGKWNANPPHTTGSNLAYGIIERQAVAQVTITSFTPSSGKIGDGVAIYGTNLTGASSVEFNGTPATSFEVLSDTLIAAHVPEGATTGQISVTANAKSATSADVFTVYEPAQLEVMLDLGAEYLGDPGQVQLNYTLVGPQTYNGVLPINGGMALLTDIEPGTYTLTLSGSHWLTRIVKDIAIEGVKQVNVFLVNGDSDGDDQINLFDFVVLDINFDKAHAMADLDGSGSVNLFDYVIIDTYFGAQGDK